MFTMQHSASPSAEKSRLRNLAICENGEDGHVKVASCRPPVTVTQQIHHYGLATESPTFKLEYCSGGIQPGSSIVWAYRIILIFLDTDRLILPADGSLNMEQ